MEKGMARGSGTGRPRRGWGRWGQRGAWVALALMTGDVVGSEDGRMNGGGGWGRGWMLGGARGFGGSWGRGWKRSPVPSLLPSLHVCPSPHASLHLPSPPPPPISDHRRSHFSQYLVHLGEHNLQRWDGYEQTRTATKSFPHPHFNNSLPNKDHRNDIMLVKMSSAAVITRAVRPLTLSSQCVTAGTSCLISGWGTTSSPQCRGSRRGQGGGARGEGGITVEAQRELEELSKRRHGEFPLWRSG